MLESRSLTNHTAPTDLLQQAPEACKENQTEIDRKIRFFRLSCRLNAYVGLCVTCLSLWVCVTAVLFAATVFETTSGSLLEEDGFMVETVFQSSPGSAIRAIKVPTLISFESSPNYRNIMQLFIVET